MVRLSIVIPTYNRSSKVLLTLEKIAKQRVDFTQFECIVVDNNSQDDTHIIVETFIAEHPELNVRYAFEPKQGLSHARNTGIDLSKGDIIAFIDDDESVVYDFTQRYINFFDRYPEAMAAGGRIVPEYMSKRPNWMSHHVERPIANPLYYGDYIKPFPRGKCPGGGNMAVRKVVFDKIGCFNTELGRKGESLIGGEECELFERMREHKLPIYYVPRASIYHRIYDEKLTDEYLTKLFYNVGVSQRMRAKLRGRQCRAFVAEFAKWGATLLLCLTYRPQRSCYLLKLRYNISKGLFSGKKR